MPAPTNEYCISCVGFGCNRTIYIIEFVDKWYVIGGPQHLVIDKDSKMIVCSEECLNSIM